MPSDAVCPPPQADFGLGTLILRVLEFKNFLCRLFGHTVRGEFEVNWAVIQVGNEVGSSKAARATVIQPMMQLHTAVCCRGSYHWN